MIITTDGQKFVWGVFGADGCECENLEKLFETEKSATEFLQRIQREAVTEGTWQSHPEIYGDPRFASARAIEVKP